MSQSTTPPAEEHNPGIGTDGDGASEFVWMDVEATSELQEQIGDLESALANLRDQRDRFKAKAARADELEQEVERLRAEKRVLLEEREARSDSSETDESCETDGSSEQADSVKQLRRKARLWTYHRHTKI